MLFDNDFDWLRLKLKCVVMKLGLVMMEFQDLETHLNLIKDFTGSRVRMSNTTSSGTGSDKNIGFLVVGGDIVGLMKITMD